MGIQKKYLTLKELPPSAPKEFLAIIRKGLNPEAESTDAQRYVQTLRDVAQKKGVVGMEMLRKVMEAVENGVIQDPKTYANLVSWYQTQMRKLNAEKSPKTNGTEPESPALDVPSGSKSPEEIWKYNCQAKRLMYLLAEEPRTEEEIWEEAGARSVSDKVLAEWMTKWRDPEVQEEFGWALTESNEGKLLLTPKGG